MIFLPQLSAFSSCLFKGSLPPSTQTNVDLTPIEEKKYITRFPLKNNANGVKNKYSCNINTLPLCTHNKETGPVWPPPLPVGAMNRTLPLIPTHHAALSLAPPSSRHVVGVKAWGCQRETGAEIRDHPPSPPVSITFYPVAAALGISCPRIGAGIVKVMAPSEVRREYLRVSGGQPPFLLSASFLPLCRSSAPDSSRAFVSIRVTGTCGAASTVDTSWIHRCFSLDEAALSAGHCSW